MQGRNRDPDIENVLVDAVGGEGRTNSESSIKTDMLLYIK